MVLGILALVIPYAGFVLAIIGLALGVDGKKKCIAAGAPSGMATAGVVMSIIALAWSVACLIILSAAVDMCSSSYYYW
jgi:uncharacterized YccA/Bax inhibitor family protein